MNSVRLKAWIWVQAQIMACDRMAIPITIVRKGNEEAGVVLLKLNRGKDGCEVFSQTRTAEGDTAWFRATGEAPVSETDADAYIGREMNFDPDLWVIEIEDARGGYALDGPII